MPNKIFRASYIWSDVTKSFSISLIILTHFEHFLVEYVNHAIREMEIVKWEIWARGALIAQYKH